MASRHGIKIVPPAKEVVMGLNLKTGVEAADLRNLVRAEYRRFLKLPEVRVFLEKMSHKKNISLETACNLLLDEMAKEAADIKSISYLKLI